MASIRISADSQTTSTKLWAARCESSPWIAQSRPRFDPFKIEASRHPGQWFAAGDDACDKLQRSLLEHRETFIQEHPEVPVHRINFAKLTEDPETVTNELIAFLGIEPTAEESIRNRTREPGVEEVRMTPVEDVLARFRHRYLIIGSGALRLHGIDWEEGDLDIWLDPNLSDEDWQALSMMPLILSSDLGSEESPTALVVSVHQLESPVRHRWT